MSKRTDVFPDKARWKLLNHEQVSSGDNLVLNSDYPMWMTVNRTDGKDGSILIQRWLFPRDFKHFQRIV